jgi:hypothetical protein
MRNDLIANPWFRGNHPICLLGEDRNFIEQFVTPYIGRRKPLDAYDVFQLGGEKIR